MLSDTNLTSLSYSMLEESFVRGQDVYREGIDSVDKIYLIKSGEFELFKNLIKPIVQHHTNYLFKPISSHINGEEDKR